MFGRGYLDHAVDEIHDLLEPRSRVVFVPFALHDRAAYFSRARSRLGEIGYQVIDVEDVVRGTDIEFDAIFVGGGNTFRLLKGLQDSGLVALIRQHVQAGKSYIGSSAGAIVAGPTIKTTKDMPIVQPRSFESLGLVEFQISPHFLDPDPGSTHMGETQEERINQFLEENDAPVVGLREGGMLRIDGGSVVLKGTIAARLFARNRRPIECQPGALLAEQLASS
jgi:dipeptidase E